MTQDHDQPRDNTPAPRAPSTEPPKKRWYQKLGHALGEAVGEWFANR